MEKKIYLRLFALGALLGALLAALQQTPGYMDADYYFYMGDRLASGKGFTEMILWNYLDDPMGIPHAAFTYWMPLTSIVAAAGLLLGGSSSGFDSAQIGFVLLVGAVPVVTAALSYRLTGRKDLAVTAGVFSLLSGFYLPFLTTTDGFSLFMVLGGLFFYSAAGKGKYDPVWVGLAAGLLHLTRVDGILWLAAAFFWIAARGVNWSGKSVRLAEGIREGIFVLGGYLAVMGPWFARNRAAFGSFMAPGGSQTLWMTNFNQLYAYPNSLLTMESWLSSGWKDIFSARFHALGQNLVSTFVVQGMVILWIFALIGIWKYKTNKTVWVGGLIWGMTIFLMSFAFPYSGERGGYFHSSAGLMPLLWALAPAGFQTAGEWVENKRGWRKGQGPVFFRNVVFVVVLGISAFLLYSKLGPGSTRDSSTQNYLEIDNFLVGHGLQSEDIVMVNNPPGYAAATGRPAIVIPDGERSTLASAAERYGAAFIVLEYNHPPGLDSLYDAPVDFGSYRYLDSFAEMIIFIRVEQTQ